MIPVVDACLDFRVPETGDGRGALDVLADFLRHEQSVHLLRAVHASRCESVADVCAEARTLEKLASTPGSGGLPNALVASVGDAMSDVPALLADTSIEGRLRAVHVGNAPAGDHDSALLASLAERHIALEVNLTRPPARVARHESLSRILYRLAAPAGRSDLDAGKLALDGVRHEARAGSQVAINVIGLGAVNADPAHPPSVEALRHAIGRAVDAVGVDHVLLSSGHTLSSCSSAHDTIWSRLTQAVADRSASERDRLLRRNAIDWYRL